MSAAEIVKALGGRRAGRDWMALCPAHDDREPSLAIREGRDGKVLLKCHAGCGQWEIVSALKDRGIWSPRKAPFHSQSLRAEVRDDADADRTVVALRLWRDCADAQGTLVEKYLCSRGLTLPPPDSLRFHSGLKHPSASVWPAMVALVRDVDGKPLAIHRTFLAKDGSGKAPVSPAKMMLGPTRGGSVQLTPAASTLAIGEGIETTLSVMQSTGMACWAALSTSGMKALVLPAKAEEVIILADADEPGEAAARASAARWMREGRRVRIARPGTGKDFNDVLRLSLDQSGRAA